MRKHLSKILALVLILGISTVLVFANYSSPILVTYFEVDFDFQIGNSNYSKGRYKLSRETNSVLILENLTESEVKVLLGTNAYSDTSKDTKSILRFNRYDERYFLREVISPLISAKIRLSKAEKKARHNARQKLAKVKIEGKK